MKGGKLKKNKGQKFSVSSAINNRKKCEGTLTYKCKTKEKKNHARV